MTTTDNIHEHLTKFMTLIELWLGGWKTYLHREAYRLCLVLVRFLTEGPCTPILIYLQVTMTFGVSSVKQSHTVTDVCAFSLISSCQYIIFPLTIMHNVQRVSP